MAQTLLQNTEWTSGSMHTLSDTLQIAAGVTLTIDPGAVVSGGSIQVFGSLHAQGTADNKILFNNVNLNIAGSSGVPASILIDYSILQGGTFLAPTGNAVYGNFSLTNSAFKNVGGYAYVWYPTGNDVISGNLFDGFGGFSTGTNGPEILISYNTFVNITPSYATAAVANWATYNNSQVIVDHNNFLDVGKPALALPSGYSNATLTVTNNYFGTSNLSVISSMIFDKNDDLASAGYISTASILSGPAPSTPFPPARCTDRRPTTSSRALTDRLSWMTRSVAATVLRRCRQAPQSRSLTERVLLIPREQQRMSRACTKRC
jgi:hypothetical protein